MAQISLPCYSAACDSLVHGIIEEVVIGFLDQSLLNLLVRFALIIEFGKTPVTIFVDLSPPDQSEVLVQIFFVFPEMLFRNCADVLVLLFGRTVR